MPLVRGGYDDDAGASPSIPGVATISAKHALAEAKRGAARASLALAVMAPPQDAPEALMTAAELAADADDSETAADAHYRLASGGSMDALTHLQQATAFADKAAQESQSRAKAETARARGGESWAGLWGKGGGVGRWGDG